MRPLLHQQYRSIPCAPLRWSEVTARLHPSKFTIRSMPKRIAKVGDLWAPVLGAGIDMEAALARLLAEH